MEEDLPESADGNFQDSLYLKKKSHPEIESLQEHTINMKQKILYITSIWLFPFLAAAQEWKPIIDVHLHAYIDVPPGEKASWTGEPEACSS